MSLRVPLLVAAALVCESSAALAQGRGGQPLPAGQTNDPFPQPIERTAGVIAVNVREFATLPDIDSVAARAMTLVDEPTSRRLFVSNMQGLLYVMSPDGRTVNQYLDLRDAKWGVGVQARGRERGIQSFTLHPQFAQPGSPGYGKFYTYTDVVLSQTAPDFTTPRETPTHDLVLHEWTARTPAASAYDGEAPRELIRWRQPYANHNGGAVMFNRTARRGSADYGLLYIGVGDGGSGGDPMMLAQNLGSAFGKILRIDPHGKNSTNGKYGIPASNPFVNTAGALGEIYAYGVRNSQRFGWDSKNGQMYMSDIGQNVVEEVSPVTAGANLGWNTWEASFRFTNGAVRTDSLRADPKVTYPIAEWDQRDSILLSNNSSASVGVIVYRNTNIPQLANRIIFGDMPSGEMFYVSADEVPKGGQDVIRRVLFVTAPGAQPRPMLQIIQEKNRAQGKPVASRADLRFDLTGDGRIFLLNKADGVVRVIER